MSRRDALLLIALSATRGSSFVGLGPILAGTTLAPGLHLRSGR